ncbi:MAG TPA: c-type cytochrome, methanol metabolism-related [Paracoccaceae bacterium]|nr:c-type cytochrome, methanol metabolism-related [Paracoccaceae bacterium]
MMILAAAALVASMATAAGAQEQGQDSIAAVENIDGKYYTADGIPTFNVAEDGTVDWYTYSGFRRYHSECHVCHGPDGAGSSYAPALADSVMRMDYYEFMDVVVNGKTGAIETQVMPGFGLNRNVMCYLDDIYIYLRARGADAIPRGRPQKKEAKPDAFSEAEDSCMG